MDFLHANDIITVTEYCEQYNHVDSYSWKDHKNVGCQHANNVFKNMFFVLEIAYMWLCETSSTVMYKYFLY